MKFEFDASDMEPVFQKLYDDLLEAQRLELESLKSLGRRYGVEFEASPGVRAARANGRERTQGTQEQLITTKNAKDTKGTQKGEKQPGVPKLVVQMLKLRGAASTLDEIETVIRKVLPEIKRTTIQAGIYYLLKTGKLTKIEAQPPERPKVTYSL